MDPVYFPSVYVLLMTSQSIADDVAYTLANATVANRTHEKSLSIELDIDFVHNQSCKNIMYLLAFQRISYCGTICCDDLSYDADRPGALCSDLHDICPGVLTRLVSSGKQG